MMGDAPRPIAARARLLLDRVRGFREALERSTAEPGDDTFLATMDEFLGFVRASDDAMAWAEIERMGEVAANRPFFAPRVLRFTWAMESRTHASLMKEFSSQKSPTPPGPLLRAQPWGAYARMGETLDLCDFSGCRRAIMVGCGPVPDSLFCLHDQTAIPELVGLDHDSAALRMARELVCACGFQDRIRIVGGDARAFDYAGFDLICCSVFAAPRGAVVERIAATAGPGALVILREPSGPGTLLFESVLGALPARFEPLAASAAPRGRFMLSYRVFRLGAIQE